MSEIYQRIENLCKKAGINITIMCKATGVPRSALSDYKAERTKSLSAATLSKIATYFGVSVDYLLGNKQKEKPAVTEDSELAELVKDELVGFYGDIKNELTEGDVRDLITLMKIRAELNRRKEKD